MSPIILNKTNHMFFHTFTSFRYKTNQKDRQKIIVIINNMCFFV